MVLGQNDFSSTSLPANLTRSWKNYLSQPSGLAFDPEGRLFIADSSNRVVVYAPPFAIGQASVRVMGVVTTPNAPLVSESTLGAVGSNGRAVAPQAVFFIGSNPYVVDTGNARILGYNPFDAMADRERRIFAARADRSSDRAIFTSAQSNQGLAQPNAATFAGPQPNPFVGGPVSAVFDGTGNLYVVDSGNNRVLAFPQQQPGIFTSATRLLGQSDFAIQLAQLDRWPRSWFQRQYGLVQRERLAAVCAGRERGDRRVARRRRIFISPIRSTTGCLGYRDYRQVNADVTADLVIGQPDLFTALVNYPSNSPTQANAQGLWSPEGLAVDAKGNLYVADTCNARVSAISGALRANGRAAMPQANLVLGQTSLVGQPIKDVSAQTMKSAYGLAFTSRRRPGGFRSSGESRSLFQEDRAAIFSPANPRATFSASPISIRRSPACWPGRI